MRARSTGTKTTLTRFQLSIEITFRNFLAKPPLRQPLQKEPLVPNFCNCFKLPNGSARRDATAKIEYFPRLHEISDTVPRTRCIATFPWKSYRRGHRIPIESLLVGRLYMAYHFGADCWSIGKCVELGVVFWYDVDFDAF